MVDAEKLKQEVFRMDDTEKLRANASGMNNAEQAATSAFARGCNCAQAVFCAFSRDMGLSDRDAMRFSEGFGGGVGGCREICGALSGGCAAISWHYSDGEERSSGRRQVYAAVSELIERFRAEYGAVTCRELLSRAARVNCADKVALAARAAQEIIERRGASASARTAE